jgi:hypothetical protein
MVAVNTRRVWLGTLLGWVVWSVWSVLIHRLVLAPHYAAVATAGTMLKTPRYPFFPLAWFVMLFVLAGICAWLYAGVRGTRGAGPATALKVGFLVGFAGGFPLAFLLASWATFPRVISLWWMLDMWFGAILATLVAGWTYRD